MSLRKLKKQLSNSVNALSQGKYFLAAAVWSNEQKAKHVGLLINADEGLYMLHYTGEYIVFEEFNFNLYSESIHFNLLFCLPMEDMDINLYFARFKLIEFRNQDVINYGFFFPDARFTIDGEYYVGKNWDRLYTTCVGFCLLTLNGLMDPEYFLDPREWDQDNTLADRHRATYLMLMEGLANIDQVQPHIKRIPPSEFFGASFVSSNHRTKSKAQYWGSLFRQFLGEPLSLN
jgi:hypothetical protein